MSKKFGGYSLKIYKSPTVVDGMYKIPYSFTVLFLDEAVFESLKTYDRRVHAKAEGMIWIVNQLQKEMLKAVEALNTL